MTGNVELTKPLRAWTDDEGIVRIIDANGLRVCVMDDVDEEGERKAELIVLAFNKASRT